MRYRVADRHGDRTRTGEYDYDEPPAEHVPAGPNLRPALKEKVMSALVRIAEALPGADYPVVHNQAKAYMRS